MANAEPDATAELHKLAASLVNTTPLRKGDVVMLVCANKLTKGRVEELPVLQQPIKVSVCCQILYLCLYPSLLSLILSLHILCLSLREPPGASGGDDCLTGIHLWQDTHAHIIFNVSQCVKSWFQIELVDHDQSLTAIPDTF